MAAATTAATTVVATTTDHPATPDARPTRSGVSVRTRITAAVALLTVLALTGAGAIVYLIEAQRVEDQMVHEIDQELAELSALQHNGLDPATGKPYVSVGIMLDTFLARNVPDDNEILVSWYDGGPRKTSSHRTFVDSAFFRDTVTPLLATNGTARARVPSYGEALFTVQSVRRGGDTGALVVVTYLEEGRAGLRDTMRTYTIVALLSLLLVTAAAGWLSGRLLAPLRTLRETTDDIGEGDLSQRLPVRGNDDITALTHTVNGMLGRLESAFAGQRRFLDDAGHELKTPLTVLRGHLELLNTGNEEDVVETRELLLDEVDRMSRLVGDLILLAKSDRPDFVTTRPVDLARLTEDVLAKSRGLGDRAWTLDGIVVVKVVADEQRITQAVLQLADNAVKHTGPGDLVAIGSSYDGVAARLWVRDTGPGVPAEDRERIFERFGRSDVADGDEGFGLGLSIVRAIATAHGGTVTLEDAAPSGARFVVTLPVARPGAEEDAWPTS
ncbi:MAG: ATP-binding region, ATPase domain protein [Nocardioides sp.]|nr:ATP-binding region, ATPase domain protein [Nocardioides sp.]